jgi:WXG100 family type VII secretion target
VTNFAVDLGALRQVAARSDSVGAELRAELDCLQREVDAVLTGAWLGRAADRFDRVFAEWEVGARRMLAALDDLAASVEAGAGAYLGSDAAASDDLVRAAR